MSEYTCEGLGTIPGGIYDTLRIEGVFSAGSPIKANTLICEGVVNFSVEVTADTATIEGVVNINGPLRATSLDTEGVLNADCIVVSDSVYSDGVIRTDFLSAKDIKLYYNEKKDNPHPFTKFLNLFRGKSAGLHHNAKIAEIQADTLYLENYQVLQITGKDVTIGEGCSVDEVQADTKLRIHKTATVKACTGSATPEYFE